MNIHEFVKERDEALLSLDKERILKFTRKYGVQLPTTDKGFWGGVHKAILHLESATDEQKEYSKQWLLQNNFKLEINI